MTAAASGVGVPQTAAVGCTAPISSSRPARAAPAAAALRARDVGGQVPHVGQGEQLGLARAPSSVEQ